MKEIRSRDERKVLGHYAGGRSTAEIVRLTGLTNVAVTAVLTAINYDRDQARALVTAYDDRVMSSGPKPVPAAPPAPTITQSRTSADLLSAGDQSSQQATRTLSARIRALLDDLSRRLDAEQATEQARREIAEAQQALDAARARLAQVTGKGKPAPAATAGPTAKQVRAWAAEQGFDCPATGRIPQYIRDAYQAHTTEER